MNEKLPPTKINKLEIELGLKEKSPIELFYDNPCEWTLRNISKRIQTPEMVRLAVEKDGKSIKSVSKKLITDNLCKIAVSQNGAALSYIPQKFINPELCMLAVENDGMAIKNVPIEWITPQMAFQAINHKIFLSNMYQNYPIHYIPNEFITEQLVNISITNSPCSLKNIPKEFVSNELYALAVSIDGAALEYVPENKRSKSLISSAVSTNPIALKFAPEKKITKEMCEVAFKNDPFIIRFIPEKYITHDMCLKYIEACENDSLYLSNRIHIGWLPDKMRNDLTIIDEIIKKTGVNYILDWNNKIIQKMLEYDDEEIHIKPLAKETTNYLQSIIDKTNSEPIPKLQIADVETPPSSPEAFIIKPSSKSNIYDLTLSDDTATKTIYYISDIHLEHQFKNILGKDNTSYGELSAALDNKITELIKSAKTNYGYLLIGGDVGHHKGFVSLFYYKLRKLWDGTIISVLGNHELWDSHPEGTLNGYVPRSIDEIIDDYREGLNSVVLQNEVFISYKNRKRCIIREKQILNSSDEDLREIFSKTDFIVLGGVGFSGLNQRYNAEFGLYRSAVTTIEEDKALSAKFKLVYDKVKRCASELQVIVLTHTPVYDWMNEPCNPNWVYINGHTHQNSLIRKQDGTTVLSDNQVGYKPSKWKLNAFKIHGWYDPFKDMENGIHEISSEMYKDYNNARGIRSNGIKHDGQIYVIKRNDLYMFLLKSNTSLCILSGGRRKRLDNNDLNYYYENMETYAQRVKEAVSPYQKALRGIAREICRIGGWGNVHGCIVDIDFFNHIYLNPHNEKITPYFATDISSRIVYDDLPSLLDANMPEFKKIFDSAYKKGNIPLLSQYAVAQNGIKNMAVAKVPQLVCGTEIYESSRIMMSIQYIFDNNTIRIWSDDILNADFGKNLPILTIENQSEE